MTTAYPDPRFKLGSLCKRGHDYNGTGQSLRYAGCGSCRDCTVAAAAARNARRNDPDRIQKTQEQRRQYKRRLRQRLRAQGLTCRGSVPFYPTGAESREETPLRIAIQRAGRCPTVAALVAREQSRWNKAHPPSREEIARARRERWRLAYVTRPELRLYTREKSRRRQAAERGQTPVQISVSAIRSRFALFGNCCAYCGAEGDMQMEHVEPISKGGAHDVLNIVPACMRCNYNKRDKPMQQWYECQPFFKQERLDLINRYTSTSISTQLEMFLT